MKIVGKWIEIHKNSKNWGIFKEILRKLSYNWIKIFKKSKKVKVGSSKRYFQRFPLDISIPKKYLYTSYPFKSTKKIKLKNQRFNKTYKQISKYLT